MLEYEGRRIEEIFVGFIIVPSQDEGLSFFRTDGLPKDEIDQLAKVLQEQGTTGSPSALWPILKRYRDEMPPRIISFDDLIEPFSNDNEPIRIKFLIEDLGNPKLP